MTRLSVAVLAAFALVAPLSALAERPLEEVPRSFAYDGCTFFGEGTPENPGLWSDCCLEHDLLFWGGGPRIARDRADLALRDCVAGRVAPAVAWVMYLGVRAGA
jgi:hypothetical protein